MGVCVCSQYFSAHGAAVEDVANLYTVISNSDSKMKVFMETTTDHCKRLVETEIAKLNKKVDKVLSKFAEFTDKVDRRLESFVNNQNAVNENITRIMELSTKIEEQKKEIKDVINGYKSFTNENTAEEFEKSSTRAKLTSLQQDFQTQQQEVSVMVRELKDFDDKNQEFRRDVLSGLEAQSKYTATHNEQVEDKLTELTNYLAANTNARTELSEKVKTLEAEIEKTGRGIIAGEAAPTTSDTTATDALLEQMKKLQGDVERLEREKQAAKKDGNNPDARRSNKQNSAYEGRNIDTLFCMDSNSKHIRFKKLWTVKNSARRRIYTHTQLGHFINNLKAESVKSILIHVGVNDVDHKTGQEVFSDIKKNIETLKNKYPTIKVILAEVTPRKDAKDEQVNICNRLINEWATNQDDLFIASHENLRKEKTRFLEDNKHISRKQIGPFVVNLKKALCQASGIPYLGRAAYKGAEARTVDDNTNNSTQP